MNWALTTMASGRFLWAFIILGAFVLGFLSVHLPKVYALVTAPFRALWARVKVWKPVAWVLTKIGNTLTWKWLESHQYDPPARPLTWYLKVGSVIMVLWLASGYVLFDHARKTAPHPSMAFIGARIETEWKGRALACETREADAYTREPAALPNPATPEPFTVPVLAPTPPSAVKAPAPRGVHRKPKDWWEMKF